jgi:hypothetical protein
MDFHVELLCGVAVEVGEEVAGETDIFIIWKPT